MDIASNDDRRPLSVLEGRDEFVGRHIGPNDREVAAMLATLGVTESTLKWHIRAILNKCDATNLAEVARLALCSGPVAWAHGPMGEAPARRQTVAAVNRARA